MHIDDLPTCLKRGALYATNHVPGDGLPYKTIHNISIQERRQREPIPCGPGATIHDYVSFYLGPRSPMLLQLHTDQVEGYNEGQEPILYLVSTIERVRQGGERFVFSDGHGIAHFTRWFDEIRDLEKVDWDAVYARQWNDTLNDMDRQRRKQAEFLVYESCPWELIETIGVLNSRMKQRVEKILDEYPESMHHPVTIHSDWYY